MEKILIESLNGFGDNVYVRPLVIEESKHRDVYVVTPYPQLYAGTGIKVVKPSVGLYDFANRSTTDCSNINWCEKPQNTKFLRPTYSQFDLASRKTISSTFSKGFTKKVLNTKLKATDRQISLGYALLNEKKNVMLVKIPSFRHDWNCESRTPKTQYMIECMKMAKANGYNLVSLQDFTLGDKLENPELAEKWLPLCSQTLHGKLTIDEIIGLFAVADSVLTYPNFLLPLALYMDKPVFCLYGGSVSPQSIYDPRIGALCYRYVAPEPFCNCVLPSHECNKEIPIKKLKDSFDDFLTAKFEKESKFYWDDYSGYGYYPVNNENVYNDVYFRKYEMYESTQMGMKLNEERVKLARKVSDGPYLDIGIGSGQFVKSGDNFKGFDVGKESIEFLNNRNLYIDFWKRGAYDFDLVTFFDSFEHEDDISGLVEKCVGRKILMSIPIFKSREHALKSKHFRTDEHFHYFTRDGLIKFFKDRNYRLVIESDIEKTLGREDIGTFVFEQIPINDKDYVDIYE